MINNKTIVIVGSLVIAFLVLYSMEYNKQRIPPIVPVEPLCLACNQLHPYFKSQDSQSLGTPINILTLEEGTPFLKFCCNKKQWFEGYEIPDGFDYLNQNDQCEFTTNQFIATDLNQYAYEFKKQNFAIPHISVTPGELTQKYKMTQKQMQGDKKYILQENQLHCNLYDWKMSDYKLVRLNKAFKQAVKQLPLELNKDTIKNYFTFFDGFGTHFTIRKNFGGKLTQQVFSEKFFYDEEYNPLFALQQAESCFYKAINKEQQETFYDPEFWNKSLKFDIEQIGGKQIEQKHISPENWMKEVSKNPQVIAKKMLDISVFMTKFHIDDLVNPEIIQANTKEAFKQYLQRPGCTDPAAVNWSLVATVNDGTCVYKNAK